MQPKFVEFSGQTVVGIAGAFNEASAPIRIPQLQTWVPQNKGIYRDAPDFELYDQRFDPVTQSGEVDVYMPVCSVPCGV